MENSKKKIFSIIAIAIVIIIILLVIIAIIRNREPQEKVPKDYKISSFGENFTIYSKSCAGLSKKEVQDITNKIFCANHNIEKTFYEASELDAKDLQLTVWFEKYKVEGKKSCTAKEFEETLKEIYNIDFSAHGSLENTIEYSNGKYKFLDLDYEKYQSPIIEEIEINSDNSYTVKYSLTNKDSYFIHEIKYKAILKNAGNNLYIDSITEFYE